MKFWSDSWTNGDRIPARYAAGQPDGRGGARFGDNLNPHLAWSELPSGTQSMVLICHDFDVPARADVQAWQGREIPAELARSDFFHWVLVDLPPRPAVIAEGEFSRGFVARGKPGPQARDGARHGLNDYTHWFDGHPSMAGEYYGYDGPYPPAHDALVHHYVFTLYAVALPRLPVDGRFTGEQVRQRLAGQVLAEATCSGTYTLNPRLLDAGA